MASPRELMPLLTMDEIPVKLRCAACNKLANDAFRLPCCDQIICGDCQASLPESCPVCLHEPISKEDCKPNKALRTTIKIFMKKKLMERDTAKKREEVSNKPTVTLTVVDPPLSNQKPALQQSDVAALTRNVPEVTKQDGTADGSGPKPPVPTEAEKDIPQESIESPELEIITQRKDSPHTDDDRDGPQGKAAGAEQERDQNVESRNGQNGQWNPTVDHNQAMNGQSFEFDANIASNMGFNGMGDFNQMMQFMPNGMPNMMMGGAFGGMMGMPGMMDPAMISQGMFGGFGGQGMGMNGMNIGTGFEAGQGAFGGFAGQPGWNASQNKFNNMAYGGHESSGGQFGANSGYGAGYNQHHQGNFNQIHQYSNNDFYHGHRGQGFQNRGRSRGRGNFYSGRGRSGYYQYNQAAQGNQANYESYQQQGPVRRGSPQYGEKLEQPAQINSQEDGKTHPNGSSLTAEEQLNKEFAPGDADDEMQDPALMPLVPPEQPQASDSTQISGTKTTDEYADVQVEVVRDKEKPAVSEPISSEPVPNTPSPAAETQAAADIGTSMPPPVTSIPTGPAALKSREQSVDNNRPTGSALMAGNDSQNMSYGQGSGSLPNGSVGPSHSNPVKPAVLVQEKRGLGVEGAPTGPKALREGRPNIGYKGFVPPSRTFVTTAQSRPSGNTQVKSPNVERHRSRSRTRSRSPVKHHSSHRRHHRHRTASGSSDSEHEERRERHRRHHRNHDVDNDLHAHKSSRTRESSPEEKRSSHRSRREYEKDKDAERNSHRSHRYRDRSRETDAENRSSKKRSPSPEISIFGASRMNNAMLPPSSKHYNKTDEESVSTSRKRRSDDEDSHRDRKRSRREQGEHGRLFDHHADYDTNERGKKGSRTDHDRLSKSPSTPIKIERPKSPPRMPKVDQHALEREARNAERVARENQRRAMQGSSGKVNGKGGRRVSYKYEDEDMTSKVETEREALRYR